MTLTYRDKTTGKVVSLGDSKNEFLIRLKSDDPSHLPPLLSARTLSVTRSSNGDNFYVARPRSEIESPMAVAADIAKIRDSEGVQGVSPAAIDAAGRTRFVVPGRVLVMLRPESAGGFDSWLTAQNLTVARRLRTPGLFEIEIPAGADPAAFMERLNGLSAVVYVEPVFYGVNDQDMRLQLSVALRPASDAEEMPSSAVLSWNLQKVDALGAWHSTTGDNRVIVVVVDGLPELTHEAIRAKVIAQPDESLFFSADRSTSSHATAVASLIAGESGRLTGVAPDVGLLPVIVNLQSQTYSDRADALHAVAALAQAKSFAGRAFSKVVLSCSWKTSGDIISIRTALQDVIAAGVVPVFSAGNDGSSDPHYPSAYASWSGPLGQCLISVAATDQDDRKSDYSCYGSSVSISAPGGAGLPLDDRDLLCADLSDGYSYGAGTSLAVPHVAATVAMMLTINPNLTPIDVKRLLLQAADDIAAPNPNYLNQLGTGRLNTRAAVEAAAAFVSSGVPGSPGTAVPGEPSPPVNSTSSNGFGVTVERAVAATDYQAIIDSLVPAVLSVRSATGWTLIGATVRKGSISAEVFM